MSKIRIYVEPQKIGDFIKIDTMSIVHKIKNVLRLVENDEVFVFDGVGKEYSAKIKYLQHDSITLRLGALVREMPRLNVEIVLAFPLTKEEKIDLILQKATELGADRFIPFHCAHGLKGCPSENKQERWQNIVREAARQSERLWLPQLELASDFNTLISRSFEQKLFGDVAGEKLETALSPQAKTILLIVGPEGDFSPEEKQQLSQAGARSVSFSPNILRLETAAIFLTGLASYFLRR